MYKSNHYKSRYNAFNNILIYVSLRSSVTYRAHHLSSRQMPLILLNFPHGIDQGKKREQYSDCQRISNQTLLSVSDLLNRCKIYCTLLWNVVTFAKKKNSVLAKRFSRTLLECLDISCCSRCRSRAVVVVSSQSVRKRIVRNVFIVSDVCQNYPRINLDTGYGTQMRCFDRFLSLVIWINDMSKKGSPT